MPAVKVTNYLYIGGFKDVSDDFDYIVNMAADSGFPKVRCAVFHMKTEDVPSYDISKYFMPAIDIIETARKNSKIVLVNCRMGISRSATIVSAYLIYHYKLSAKKAVEKLESIKSDINPNSGFYKQLEDFSKIINK